MKKLTQEEFDVLVALSSVRPRLRRELRFVSSTGNITDEQWSDSELLSIADRNGNAGVLLIDIANGFYVVPYELKTGIVSSATGRAQSIICDLCKTWQYGNKSGIVTIATDKKSSVSYLCCADLRCSLHVRNQTPESVTSRAQLREDLSIAQRVERLNDRLVRLTSELPFDPVAIV